MDCKNILRMNVIHIDSCCTRKFHLLKNIFFCSPNRTWFNNPNERIIQFSNNSRSDFFQIPKKKYSKIIIENGSNGINSMMTKTHTQNETPEMY